MLQDQVGNIFSKQISLSKKILIMKITVILAISSVCVQSAKYFYMVTETTQICGADGRPQPEAGYFCI